MKSLDGNALTALADLFLPRLCCVCGSELGRNERHVCIGCLADMPLTLNWTLRRNPMAERFNALIERNGHVEEAREDDAEETVNGGNAEDGESPDNADADMFARYVDAVALFNFAKDGGYRRITYKLKYGGDIGEGRHFSAMLGERAALAPWISDVDTVIPVPLHWTRRLKRGYNQAEVIAGEVAKALGARLRTDILVRRRRTSTQTRLGVEDKARNVRGAFAISRAVRKHSGHSPMESPTPADRWRRARTESADSSAGIRHILLVDDVFTTGSTLYNCFIPLRKFFGPEVRISIATLGVV